MNFKYRYRIVENKFGFDPQYKPWWSPFWSPVREGDEFTRTLFDPESAKEACRVHYRYSLKQNIEYFDPSKSETKMNFDYDAFLAQAHRQFVLSEGQRYGQFMMNYLHEKFPEIVVPEEYDCFYDDKKVIKLIDYLASLK